MYHIPSLKTGSEWDVTSESLFHILTTRIVKKNLPDIKMRKPTPRDTHTGKVDWGFRGSSLMGQRDEYSVSITEVQPRLGLLRKMESAPVIEGIEGG